MDRGERSGAERGRGDVASEHVYRALTRAYPEAVRRRYGDEMVRYFADLCREERLSRGSVGVALLWARTLPELVFTALKERSALFRGNAYLPATPEAVARWGALCALLGGSSGVAHYLIDYSLFGALGVLTGDPSFGSGPFMRFFTLSLLLCALSLSSLGLFGLYGAVVARSGRAGMLAGAGAIFTAASSALWLPTSGYAAVHALASGSDLFAPFEWIWNVGTFVIEPAVLFWFLGLLLLGIAAARENRLPRRLRVLPLALFALVLPSYALGHRFETVGNPVTAAVVSGFVQSLPFFGVALLGGVLLRNLGAHEAPNGSVEGIEDAGGDDEATEPAGRTAVGARALAALLLVLVVCVAAYSARHALYRTYLGLQPDAQQVGSAAYVAGERPELRESANGARVTLNSVYAEERYVVLGYEVEDLTNGRRVGGHPAELHPLIGFEGDEESLREAGLGTEVVELTDESGVDFRMVDNSGAVSEGPENMARGPLENMAAFEPSQALAPDEKHRFRFQVPLVESAVVPLGERQLPPEPFGGKPFVFDFEIPVRSVSTIEVGQKDAVNGVTLTLKRVVNSPGKPVAVVCYEPPDAEHSWYLHGGRGTYLGGWGSSGSMTGVPPADCQNLELKGPVEGRSSLEVTAIEGWPDCPSGNAKAAEACHARNEEMIHGPWTFEFESSGP